MYNQLNATSARENNALVSLMMTSVPPTDVSSSPPAVGSILPFSRQSFTLQPTEHWAVFDLRLGSDAAHRWLSDSGFPVESTPLCFTQEKCFFVFTV